MEDKDRKWLLFEYAWRWFEYHASQRLLAFRFYLIIIGAIGWFFVQKKDSMSESNYIFVGIVLFVVSLFFLFLEWRNNQLVDCGREALDKLEEELQVLNTPYAIRHKDQEKRRNNCIVSHAFVIKALYMLIGIGGVILISLGVSHLCICK